MLIAKKEKEVKPFLLVIKESCARKTFLNFSLARVYIILSYDTMILLSY